MKQMHRLIMMSETYQRSGRPSDASQLKQLDPGNNLLSHFRPRRLAAEELRDAMLCVSGELNREIGGLPVFPEVNQEFAAQPRMNQATITPSYQPSSTVKERSRRSLYVHRMRMQADPMFEVFNQPSPDLSCEQRDSSTITPQVFTLMNSDSSIDRSIAMALQIQKQAATGLEQIARAFQLAYGRSATQAEHTKMLHHLMQMMEYHKQNPPKPMFPPRELDRTVVEEMSGVALHYKEPLDVYDDYEPHVKPWDVTPETRALADVCLAMFNSNEFVYVY